MFRAISGRIDCCLAATNRLNNELNERLLKFYLSVQFGRANDAHLREADPKLFREINKTLIDNETTTKRFLIDDDGGGGDEEEGLVRDTCISSKSSICKQQLLSRRQQ